MVGAGPTGLSCAYFLAKMGYPVTVFEALPVAGGMLSVAIPEFRLPAAVIQREVDYIAAWESRSSTTRPSTLTSPWTT